MRIDKEELRNHLQNKMNHAFMKRNDLRRIDGKKHRTKGRYLFMRIDQEYLRHLIWERNIIKWKNINKTQKASFLTRIGTISEKLKQK